MRKEDKKERIKEGEEWEEISKLPGNTRRDIFTVY